jgi:phosphoserine aminotransferase
MERSAQASTVANLMRLLEQEQIAFDIGAHRTAPPGLRIWCGPTVDAKDIASLTAWLDWAWERIRPQ